MEVVGQAVLSASVESLFGILNSPDFLKFARKNEVDKELKKWEFKLSLIRAVLDDAEAKQSTDQAVKIWLNKFRDLAYDAEDILDEFYTEALRAESQASTSTMHKLLPSCCFALKPSGLRRNMKILSKLRQITARFDEIVNDTKDLELLSNTCTVRCHRVVRGPTASVVDKSKIYGRGKDKEAVLQLLKHADQTRDSPYSVIPIIGMGGLGKTTLAQLVYNDEIVESSFDCKAWICVSDDFDVLKITKAILQHWGSCEGENLNVLQESLKKMLQGKKFLIVLDDVWNENYELWTALRSPFASGALGSKIIMTSRSKVVSQKMGSIPGYALEKLSNEDCLSLLAQHALDTRNFDTNPGLKEIGVAIVQRCKGLPLAVKTLGGLLRGKERTEEWEDVLNSKMWDLPEENNLLPALRLSYHYLPSHLKQCFAFCAIFPKDYEFDDNELILLWMAQGFLQPKEKKHLDEVGREYFNDLLSRSFFQNFSANSTRYVMHDLINDLAMYVSGGLCFHLDDKPNGAKEANVNIRHSSFTSRHCDTWQRLEVFCEMKGLRTFLALPPDLSWACCMSSRVLYELVPKLKCLRALSLAGYDFEELPDSIGDLKHLRFLNLSRNPIRKLPQSLSELFNLQILLLCYCCGLVELPIDIGKLRKLQYLDIRGTRNLQMMPLQITELSNFRSLSKFIVGEGSGLGVGDLMKLQHLQGQLEVTGLNNVANSQDAKFANLKEKQGLCELVLQWNGRFDDSRDETHELHVLTFLRPHPFLQKLSISSYGGAVFPSWLREPYFSKMVSLDLYHCRNIKPVLSLGELPSLVHLRIRSMHGVKEMALKKFPALDTLEIDHMPGWEQWSHGNDEEFPKLRELRLFDSPKLVSKLPCSLPSLKELYVYGCQEAVLRNVADLPALTTLHITQISGLASLDGTLVVQAMAALEDLEVQCCDDLKYLWQDGTDLNNLANLKRLGIGGCNLLGSLVEGENGLLPCNIQTLHISDCGNLDKLPNGLDSLTSLRNLKIQQCLKLVSFPEGAGLPCTLKRLEIYDCTDLESLPDGIMLTMDGDNSNPCLLEELKIIYCRSLKSFPQGKLPTTLKSLRIQGCEKLESLPDGIMTYNNCGGDPMNDISHLEAVCITAIGNSWLTSFPTGYQFPTSLKHIKISALNTLPIGQQFFPTSLETLHIYNSKIESLSSLPMHTLSNLIQLHIRGCGKLRCLPNSMDNLTSLQVLEIGTCESLVSLTTSDLPPNLTNLEIYDCKNLAQPTSEWGLYALTSLTCLTIITNEESFPDDDANGRPLLPTSLKRLDIRDQGNLRSISKGIQHLTSLEYLGIYGCPKVQFLPKERLPATLGRLSIIECPLLVDKCKKENGGYWPILAHIPAVQFMRGSERRLPCNLQTLYIGYCKSLEKLPNGLHSLTSLRNLEIRECLKLVLFPEGASLPCTLKGLQIHGCADLESLPDGMMLLIVATRLIQVLINSDFAA